MIYADRPLDNYPTLNALGYMDGEQQKRLEESLRTTEHYRLVMRWEENEDPDR